MTSDLQDPGSSNKLDEARFLWDEYKYRHEHCWNLVFKITTAVVAILIIPYIRHDITESVGWLILTLPATAVGLLLFSYLRMDRELDVLDKVKKEHRRRQAKIHPCIGYEEHESKFKRHVKWYLVALAILAVAEIIALALSTAGLRLVSIQSSYLTAC